MIIKRLSVVVILALLLSGCALSRVFTTTTTFHIPSHEQRGSIHVLAARSEVNSSLEFLHYKSRFEQKLVANGYSIAPRPSKAQFIALVSYGIDNGETSIVSTPVFGTTGGGTTYTSGTVYGSGGSVSYAGSSYTMPSYGVVGSSTRSERAYTRAIAMDVVDAESLKTGPVRKIYEIRAKSTGWCSVIAGVFDAILEAMFIDFPGESGKPRRNSTEWRGTC